MIRKIALAALVVAVVGVLWWLIDGRQNHNSASQPKSAPTARPSTDGKAEASGPLTAATVKDLAVKLVSSDLRTYKAIWVDENVPPMAPSGTKIAIDTDTLRSYKAAGQVDAMVSIPGKASKLAVITLQFTDNQWLVCGMEVK